MNGYDGHDLAMPTETEMAWDAYGETMSDIAELAWEIANLKSLPQTSHVRSELRIAEEAERRVEARLARITVRLAVA